MPLYLSWHLLFLVGLSALYGYTQYRSVAALGAPPRRARVNGIITVLSGTALTVSWSAAGFPVPLFYVLVYLIRAARLVELRLAGRKEMFLLNLSFINTLALHLTFVGAASLALGLTMHTLLTSGFWRTLSTAAVLAAGVVEDLIFLRWSNLPAVLSAEAESEEAGPFMAFLWFCTGYLLLDSVLCVAELETLYPPLFLIGSIGILMYFVVRFLLHINALIRDEYLRDEHERLSARLEAAQENAGALQRMVDRDTLTGALSRRHIMELIDGLVKRGEPFSLAFLDLDGLKRINDSKGHDAGDRYLVGFVRAMEVRLRKGDLLSRVGGDEFLVVMPGCDAPTTERRIKDIRDMLEARDRGEAIFRFSYGVSAYLPGNELDAEALLQNADRAMYRDKASRR